MVAYSCLTIGDYNLNSVKKLGCPKRSLIVSLALRLGFCYYWPLRGGFRSYRDSLVLRSEDKRMSLRYLVLANPTFLISIKLVGVNTPILDVHFRALGVPVI